MNLNKEKYFGISPRIARWKIDSEDENWLAFKADNSPFFKKCYEQYYKEFDSDYYIKGLEFIERYLNDHKDDLISLDKEWVKTDMIYCLHRFGISFQDYWIYGFINKTFDERQSFVADKLRYFYCDLLNHPDVNRIMTDKYECYKRFRQFYKRDVLGCYHSSDFSLFFDFVNRHSQFVFKPAFEHSGHGIKLVTFDNLTDTAEIQLFFNDNIQKGAFVVEEVITQGAELDEMHKESVNSLRVMTFKLKDRVEVIGVTWRIGVGLSIVDNAGSGGIYAKVDPTTGKVITDGKNHKGEIYKTHPESDLRFKDFQMPNWDEALQLINKISNTLPGATLIAWDIVYSNRGWMMLEANESGAWGTIQSNEQIGVKPRLFSLMDEYFGDKE
ncbi:MAG: hypothetical protein HDT05_00235 [Bacteroidales bacterium]|nr:hypothetical protein [Bacteroidales bacterium]